MPQVAIRFIRGRKRFARYAEVKKEMIAVHKKVLKPHFIKQFEDIVGNWSNKPGFAARMFLEADRIRMNVFPTGSKKVKDIWNWNVKGTEGHAIEAKNAPRLIFNWGGPGSYLPKTGPGGTWYGGAGRVVGGTIRRPLAIWHPGTAPRNWPTVVAKKNKKFYSRTVENAWRRALRRINSG